MRFLLLKRIFKISFVIFAVVLGFLVLAIAGLYWASGAYMWEKQGKILQTENPYGAGLLFAKDNKILMLKISSPRTEIKDISAKDWAAGKSIEYVEPWMGSSGERLNRSNVKILHGTLNDKLKEDFSTPGQYGYWWVSPEWQRMYVTSKWIDFVASHGLDKPIMTNKLWKTEDGGKNWLPLPWPKEIDAGVPLFKDNGREGYLVGEGPRIWRTEDSCESWKEIKVPVKARDIKDDQKALPVFDMDDAGTLYFTVEDIRANTTYLYIVPWNKMPDDLNDITDPIAFEGQKIVDARRYKNGPLYVLSVHGTLAKIRSSFDVPPGGILSRIDGRQVTEVSVFEEPFSATDILPGRDNFLMVWGTRPGKVLDKPLVVVSNDNGKKWQEMALHRGAQGWYFDPDNKVLWRYFLDSLYKRQF